MREIGHTPTGHEIAAWILKANPKVYDVDAELEDLGVIEAWSVHKTYRAALMAEGQRCYLWRSGPDAAIVASGYVTGPVEPGRATVENWVDRDKAKTVDLFVPVELYRLGEEITRNELKAHPILSQIEILKMPQGSNPSILKTEEFEALEPLVSAIEERDAPSAVITTGEAIFGVYPSEIGDGSTLYGRLADDAVLEPAHFDDEMEALMAVIVAAAEEIEELPIVDPIDMDSDAVPIVQIKNDRHDYLNVYKVLGGYQAFRHGQEEVAEVGGVYSDLTMLIQAIYDDELAGS